MKRGRLSQRASRIGRCSIVLALALMVALGTAYLLALGSEAYSAWQASRMLDRLEALRIGSPANEFDRAVQPCAVDARGPRPVYELTAAPFRFSAPWDLVAKLPAGIAKSARNLPLMAGLNPWRLTVVSTVGEGRIRGIRVSFTLFRSDALLGAEWELAERAREQPEGEAPTEEERRTEFHVFHITSVPNGQGLGIRATTASTEKDLRARRINRRCLFPFGSCEGLGDILPEVLPALKDRQHATSFYDCSELLRWCDPRKDKCRVDLQELRLVGGCP